MSCDRRNFLRVAGLATAGLAANARLAAGQPASVADLAPPLSARRWAMVVDLRKWTGADGEACVRACHQAHNVPHFASAKDEVKWLWLHGFEQSFPDLESHHPPERLEHLPVPLLCNHCDNPPCTRVCPTQATWKRKSDGVVMMDWHRCIGCRYCIAACPYGSRSFNWRDPRPHLAEVNPEFPTRMRGVVEKCNFCEERLARGQLPACVEACPSGALAFGDLEDPQGEVRRLLAENFAIRRRPGLGTQPQVYYIV